MGLFVLKASDSVIDRLKAVLANLKLEERLSGDNKSYLVSDFAIPYLESVIKDLEVEITKECIPDSIKVPCTSCVTTESPIQPLKLCVDCGEYYIHETKGYMRSLCKECEDNHADLEIDE